jgi:hypothetical protein
MPTNDDTVTFDRAKLERLKTAYQNALKDKAETFWFEGKEYLVSYARYLIEYLETSL